MTTVYYKVKKNYIDIHVYIIYVHDVGAFCE